MRKSTIWVIIISMSVALLGLCGFQVYWINNSIALNKERFNRTVRATLDEVVNKLERREAIQITAKTLSTVKRNPHWIESVDLLRLDSTSRIILNTDSVKRRSRQIIIRTDTFNATPEGINEKHVYRDTFFMNLNDRLANKSDLVDVVFKQFVSDKRDITQRINSNLLDSLLVKSLTEKGIDLSYQFAVWNSEDDTLVLTNALHDFRALKNSDFRVGLFPNDLLGNVNYLMLNFPDQNQYLFSQIWKTLVASVLFVLIIVGSFSYAIFIIFRQKKLSEIKNDFINNMTHEFKTPIATISLACEAIQEAQVRGNENTFIRYIGMIRDENRRLGDQVEKVLQAAILEKDSFKLKVEETDLLELLYPMVDKAKEKVNAVKGELHAEFKSLDNHLLADRHHLTNLFYNLLDNAVKYSQGKVNIVIRTFNEGNTVAVEVQDQGIGMNREELGRIFDKFYRVPTGDRHDVKGFGLGLNYAKTIVNLHKGSISAASEPSKGSTFTVKLPLSHG
ncbi:MAG: HAMP domain-containing sensor histidine kinase [Bacteroidota bacterium]